MSPPQLKAGKKADVKTEVKAEKKADVIDSQLESGVSAASGIDYKSAWDDGFELSWSDIEEIEMIEQSALAGGRKAEVPAAAPAVSKGHRAEESAHLKLEMEDIFGRSKVTDESAADAGEEVIQLDDSIDSLGKPEELEEDSPMLCRRRLNPGRNILMTQSTPIASKVFLFVSFTTLGSIGLFRPAGRKMFVIFICYRITEGFRQGGVQQPEEADRDVLLHRRRGRCFHGRFRLAG